MSFEDSGLEFSALESNKANDDSNLTKNDPDNSETTENLRKSVSRSIREENNPQNDLEATVETKNDEELQSKHHKKSSLKIISEDGVKNHHSVRILEEEHTYATDDAERRKKDSGLEKIEDDQDEEDKRPDTRTSISNEFDDELLRINIQEKEDDGRGMSVVSELLDAEFAQAKSSEDLTIDLETFLRGSIKVDPAAERLEQRRRTNTSFSPPISAHFSSEDHLSITDDFIVSDTVIEMSDNQSSSETAMTPNTEPVSTEMAEVSTEEHLDRAMYYESYAMFKKQHAIEKLKSDFLHGRVADYYRKRKMFHILAKEAPTVTEVHKKYIKYLEELDELQDKVHAEEDRIKYDLQTLQNKCRLHNDQANELFEKLQHCESEVAKEFSEIDGSKVPIAKIIERFMKRQKLHLSNLVKMRLSYIKYKNRLIEKQDQLKSLDNLGSNFHLIDYEQLKHDNRNLRDKLEEREKELTKIREKCQNAMQILAHRREKAAAIDTDIANMSERLEVITDEYNDVREQLNLMKHERNQFRNGLCRMKNEAGLLAKPNLLWDLELGTSEVRLLSEKVKKLKKQCWDTTLIVNNMRQTMGSKTKLKEIRRELRKEMIASGAETESKKSTSTSSASSELKLEALFAY